MDQAGDLWVSTDGGLARMDISKQSFKSYDVNDGLQDNRFYRGVFDQAPDGELFFGGLNGLSAFNPHDLKENPYKPTVVLTDLLLMNRSLTREELAANQVTGPVYQAEHLILNYRDFPFAIEFSALHFADPEKNRYAYRLEGGSGPWIFTDADHRRAPFTSLSPGNYLFRVKAANKDGVWNEAATELKITILPPLWRTWYAWLLYFALLVGFVVFYVTWQRRVNNRLERMVEQRTRELGEKTAQVLETRQRLVTQEKMASLGTITAGVAHEIKNPLNFINNFSMVSSELATELKELIREQGTLINPESLVYLNDIIDDLQRNVDKIHRHGLRANQIVRRMMDLTGNDRSGPVPVEINQIVDEFTNLAYRGFLARHRRSSIRIQRELEEHIGPFEGVPRNLGRVFVNLTNNALQALREKERNGADGNWSPLLEVRTRGDEDSITVSYRDNGPGINPEHMEHIFTPFFTTKIGQGANPGLGLSISYDIVVQEHRGDIKVHSQQGEYTEFIVILPRLQTPTSENGGDLPGVPVGKKPVNRP